MTSINAKATPAPPRHKEGEVSSFLYLLMMLQQLRVLLPLLGVLEMHLYIELGLLSF